MSYTPEERETIIRMDDSEPEIMHIYTAQRKMITKLLRNPLFTTTKTETESDGRVIGLTGTLISKCLTIRTKQVKNTNGGESLKKWRESQEGKQ
jgi:hypothetical protein